MGLGAEQICFLLGFWLAGSSGFHNVSQTLHVARPNVQHCKADNTSSCIRDCHLPFLSRLHTRGRHSPKAQATLLRLTLRTQDLMHPRFQRCRSAASAFRFPQCSLEVASGRTIQKSSSSAQRRGSGSCRESRSRDEQSQRGRQCPPTIVLQVFKGF